MLKTTSPCHVLTEHKINIHLFIYLYYLTFIPLSMSCGGWSHLCMVGRLCEHWAGNQTHHRDSRDASSPLNFNIFETHSTGAHRSNPHRHKGEHANFFLFVVVSHSCASPYMCAFSSHVCKFLLSKFSYPQFTVFLYARVLKNIMGADPTCLSWSRTTGGTMGREWVWDCVVNTGQQLLF